MALNTAQLQTAIEDILDDQATREDAPEVARQVFAQRLAAALTTFVRTGTVTGDVATTGTAAAQTGTITTATIS